MVAQHYSTKRHHRFYTAWYVTTRAIENQLLLKYLLANGMGQAITMALYFLICREMGEPAIFPGNKAFWHMVDDSSYAPGIADMSVWSSTNEQCKNEAFNHVNGDVFQWRYFWPQMAAHFGMNVSQASYSSPYACTRTGTY